MKTYGKDLTSGSIPKNLFKFALPVFLANIIASGYSIINTIWVGHLLGGIAVAAVAVTFPVVMFMVAIANAATTASSVMIAHNFGAKKNETIQKVVDTSWCIGAVIVVVTTIAGICGSGQILKLLNTSPEVIPTASMYLKLTVLQFLFMYLAFLLTSVLRAVGDSKIPMMFTALGVTINAILDPLMIMGIGPFPNWGLKGAAFASIAANGITSIAALVYMWKKYAHSPLVPKQLSFDIKIIQQLFGIGLPTFIQQTLVSLSVAFITAFVNRFGPSATAAFGITGRIESLVIMPAIAMFVAVSTLTAQAMGARKIEQVPVIYKWGLLLNTPLIATMCFISILFPAHVMHLFVKSPDVVAIGVHYLKIVGWAYLMIIFVFVNNGIFIGAKKAMVTMIFSIVSLGCIRIPLAGILSHTDLGLTGIWVAICLSFGINALLGIIFYFSGKWKPAMKNDSNTNQNSTTDELQPAANV